MKTTLGIMVLVFLFPGVLNATNVGGIINSDTVWKLNGSPYTITNEVQIANGVTLTIQPRVVVHGRISVWGILNAIGTAALNITFNDVTIISNDNALNGVVNIQFAKFTNVDYAPFAYLGSGGLGNLTLTLLDSKLDNAAIGFIGPSGDCHIERNIFVNTKSNGFGAIRPNANIYIRNNVFYQWIDEYAVALANSSGLSNSKTIFEYNSFLTTNKIALSDITPIDLSLPGHTFNPEMIVANNYWGTTDAGVINSMISDRNDDLNYYTYFTYRPFLTKPHPGTPSLFKEPTADFKAMPWIPLLLLD